MNIKKNKPVIGISIGDINGIGAEVTMKALLDNRLQKMITPVIYGHGKALTYYRKALDMNDFNFIQVKSIDDVHHRKINVINVVQESPEVMPGVETRDAGSMALAAIDRAIEDLKSGQLDALVTAPLNKNNINSTETPFVGHTEYLTNAFDAKESMMFMVSEDMRIGLVTGHLPLREVANAVTGPAIKAKLKIMIRSLKENFGVIKPKIAVLGLNPHAGEDGLLGSEELETIQPVVKSFKEEGELVFGPYPSDGFFGMIHQKKFDGVLAMYHDQGLIPFKSICFDSGVNFTAGLPIIRTSPDHGTAYNIAGKNDANPGSMRSAIFLAHDMVKEKENLTAT
ncbi:4-hydroxythreonine-4-phosphate dehydrogenase PdxA [Cyclobacterium marinum]|uniref:4-hydroxythreonine-4-phosphate dehydrogenase n=1 Tax=Cyclobacterium marinum (strain ATCC 25205 / DSM 745 / LMG 13164 / NCIMB 1802) TaxID=880070 RepID=G0IUL6_CYCMS|nr:4-hydroxythreonine-4-phosphate dehydrogenase PdxA [Cyclobacterium marinum]AEL24779.1 4-hydroxythreonine-4-phosphate dehydrogenase [Cyclobacterium marinum DSM 745]MBR9776065.1 4-hydroxythreonine-4-phosphate dehydrogenase PdxA [Cytophagales bacterium]|tara:strand:+ start:138771 stop:139790 length:1020 start_codon:yes stop_codon:yes gene_type:complete